MVGLEMKTHSRHLGRNLIQGVCDVVGDRAATGQGVIQHPEKVVSYCLFAHSVTPPHGVLKSIFFPFLNSPTHRPHYRQATPDLLLITLY